jgi:hypothetical protein
MSPASTPPTRRHPGTSLVLTGSTLSPASLHRAAVERVTVPTRAPVSVRRGLPLRLSRAVS